MITRNTNKLLKGKYLISVIGPTAVGKTAVAITIAKQFNAEIISSDSRQFFQEISIGTAKPTLSEQAEVKHHFIDHLSITQDYNASDFEKEVLELLNTYFQKKSTIVMCGGSGLYVNAVINGFDDGVPTADPAYREQLNAKFEQNGVSYLQNELKKYDPEFYKQIDIHNSKRLIRALEVYYLTGRSNLEIRKGNKRSRPFSTIKIGLEMERETLYNRINKRVDKMMENGLLEEVKSVLSHQEKNALKTVGYTELFRFLKGELSLNEAVEKIKINSRRYAKRQLTWFKKENEIEWFHPDEITKIIEYIRMRIDSDEQN